MGVAVVWRCPVVVVVIISSDINNEMRKKKKNLPTAQETSYDVSWAFFSLFPLRPPVVPFPRRFVSPSRFPSVWPGGGVAAVSPFGTPVPTPRAAARGGGGVVVVVVSVVVVAFV